MGPQTALQVLDAIQRAVRGDSPRKVYTAAEKAAYRITDCRRCPLQGFAGVMPTGTRTSDGTPQYRALWSHFFCHTGEPHLLAYFHPPNQKHLNFPSLKTNLPTGPPTTGVPCEPSYPINKPDKKRRVSHEFFLPQNAINFRQQPPSRQEPPEQEQEAFPGDSPSPHAAGSVGGRPSRLPSWRAGLAPADRQQSHGQQQRATDPSSPRKQPQGEQGNGRAGGKKRLSLSAALAALLQVK